MLVIRISTETETRYVDAVIVNFFGKPGSEEQDSGDYCDKRGRWFNFPEKSHVRVFDGNLSLLYTVKGTK